MSETATPTPPVHDFGPPAVATEAPAVQPKVFIALCTRDWQSEAHTTESVRSIANQCKAQIYVRYQMNDGVARSRNNLAAAFLESDADFLFFLDNDIIIEPRHFQRLVDCMVKTKRGIVCALYPKKQPVLEWVVNGLSGEREDEDGFIRVKHAGTGAMMISRGMLVDFIAKHPEIEYRGDPSPDAKRWDLFPMRAIDGAYKSEDWAFCEMATASGWDIWVDGRSQLRHIGKCVYPLQFTMTDEEVIDIVHHRYHIPQDQIRTFIASGQRAPGLMGGHREKGVRHWPREFPVGDLHQGDVLAGCFDVPYELGDDGQPFSIIDIGADVGAFARWAAKRWPKCPIHSYEWRPELLGSLQITANNVGDRYGLVPTVYAGEIRGKDVGALPAARVLKIDAKGLEREILEALQTIGRLPEFDAIMVRYADELTEFALRMMLGPTHMTHCIQPLTTGGGILKFLRRAQ